MCVLVFVCVCVCVAVVEAGLCHVCVFVWGRERERENMWADPVCMHVCMHACVCVCVCACVCVCVGMCMFVYVRGLTRGPTTGLRCMFLGCQWPSWILSTIYSALSAGGLQIQGKPGKPVPLT